MKSVHEVLVAARERIATPDKWKKGYFAVDRANNPVSVDNPEACRFCMAGAIFRVVKDHPLAVRDSLMVEVFDVLEHMVDDAIPDFNDTHAHADVLAVFDKAIAATKGTS